VARLSNAEKILLRKSMVRPAVNSALSVVKPTRSQNKMVASATLSAMISPDRREAALKASLL
jgi:hypothetical protein